jgi:hypothetical protein
MKTLLEVKKRIRDVVKAGFLFFAFLKNAELLSCKKDYSIFLPFCKFFWLQRRGESYV